MLPDAAGAGIRCDRLEGSGPRNVEAAVTEDEEVMPVLVAAAG